MPRYLVERLFSGGLELPLEPSRVVETNGEHGVTWLHTYVSDDRTKTFCVYDAATPEAIRKAAATNGLPVERITQVRVLDPYFYQ